MSDIVERLRGSSWLQRTYSTYEGNRWEHINPFSEVPREAADTIEQMREAMRQIALALHEAGHTPKHGQSLADALRAALSAPAPAPAEAVLAFADPENLPWLLTAETAMIIANRHRVRVGTVQAIAKAVQKLHDAKAAPAAPAGWQPAGFDEALGQYAAAVRAMDSDGMRAGYVALRAMLAAAPGA